jgi:hypothetical protein
MRGDPFIAKDPWAKESRNVFDLKKRANGSTGEVEIVLASRPGQRRS